jgi:hypothetical protein
MGICLCEKIAYTDLHRILSRVRLTTSNLILNKSLSFTQINFLEKYLGIFEAGSTIHGIYFVREHRI